MTEQQKIQVYIWCQTEVLRPSGIITFNGKEQVLQKQKHFITERGSGSVLLKTRKLTYGVFQESGLQPLVKF